MQLYNIIIYILRVDPLYVGKFCCTQQAHHENPTTITVANNLYYKLVIYMMDYT